jgi:O-antigen/teichoic acid export membrane protein
MSVGVSLTIAALGQIIGVRLLTEALSPAVFGQVALAVGMSALAISVFVNPTMQALLRYYPECAQTGNEGSVQRTALRRILRASVWALPLSLPFMVLSVVAGWYSPGVMLLLIVLVVVDGMRTLRTAILNSCREHHRYGVWQIGEAWGRPMLAYGATVWLGIHVELVLVAYILTSLGLYYLLTRATGQPPLGVPHGIIDEVDLLRRFESYARPLIPLGLVGWVSSMADRYMIGGLLSVGDVGMYAAAYGIASRPMLMMSSAAETAIRPVYYSAVARRDREASRKYVMAWFGIILAVGTVVCGLLALFHRPIAHLLLGPQFREASHLIPLIAAGYSLLALYHISARVSLAHDAPHLVTISETIGAIAALAIGFLLIGTYGLTGAAVALPIAYGIQLIVSVYLGARIRSRLEGP